MGARTQHTARSLAQATLFQIEERLHPALGPDLLKKPASGDHSRQRVFSLVRTFWCWIWQILQANTSCREVVRQVQALFVLYTQEELDEATSGYCQARSKLPLSLLEGALEASARSAQQRARPSPLLQGRPIKVGDGSGVRLPDTLKNRQAFPPSENQFPIPSFPILKVVALYGLASGAILAKSIGSLCTSELRLLMKLRPSFQPKDILVSDRAYGCFVLAAWLQGLGVDLIARLATRSRHVDFRKACQRLGPQDGWFRWRKPARPSLVLSKKEWAALPDQITVRILHLRIDKPGFRTRQLTVVTTLLDADLYPAQEILQTYFKRWRLEMCLDDLKTTLHMEMLKCKTPKMVHKELLIFLTAHNFLRWIMAQAAWAEDADLERISFKGTLDAFRQWTACLVQIRGPGRKAKRNRAWRKLLATLVADLLPWRPGRQEPRAIKRRSKYPHLNKPRHKYVERWSRNKRRRIARTKKNALVV
jgi:hypothetical protein